MRASTSSASTIAIAGAFFGTTIFMPSEARAANAAESFVQSNIDKGYSILNANLPDQQRHEGSADEGLCKHASLLDGGRGTS